MAAGQRRGSRAVGVVDVLAAVPLIPIERRAFDYINLNAAMSVVDQAMRNAQRTLPRLARGSSASIAARKCPVGDAPFVTEGDLDNEEASSHVPLKAVWLRASHWLHNTPDDASETWTW